MLSHSSYDGREEADNLTPATHYYYPRIVRSKNQTIGPNEGAKPRGGLVCMCVCVCLVIRERPAYCTAAETHSCAAV